MSAARDPARARAGAPGSGRVRPADPAARAFHQVGVAWPAGGVIPIIVIRMSPHEHDGYGDQRGAGEGGSPADALGEYIAENGLDPVALARVLEAVLGDVLAERL